ncbi:unnamed protein product [Trichobilharzia regenti]|nr:unnamed protein product [Trichobilharzia regenti]
MVMFLTRSASISASSSKSYKYLTSHRVQKYLLHELGSLCKQVSKLRVSFFVLFSLTLTETV